MPILLKYIEGSKAGQVDSFDQDNVRIGRQSDNDVQFDPRQDASVSGYHAEIYRDGEAFFIKDLQSRNGTFVNSHKIDQPVLLKEGDVLQFSGRGPKLVFSMRDPSLSAQTAVLETEATGPTLISAVGEEPKPEKKQGIWAKIRPIVLSVSAVVALTALVGVGHYLGFSWWALLIGAAIVLLAAGGAYLGWRFWKRGILAVSTVLGLIALAGIGHYLGFSWWALLIGAAVILLVAGSAYLGWRFSKRRKALREQKAAAHQEREASLGRGEPGNLQDLRRKWTEVIRSLRESKLKKMGDDAIYAFPWFMLLGEPGCGKSVLVRTSGPQSSVTSRAQDGPTRNCDWWFFDKVVVLDTSGRYAFQAKESDSAVEWQELLGLLGNQRRREPVNGVIVTLPADSLSSKPTDKLKEEAAQLRARLDEMVQRLGVKFPVYLAITKCDLITGFNQFFDALPEQVRGQAFGQVNPEALNDSDVSRFFDQTFRRICERTERLRLALLYERERADETKGMFLFPAELKNLQTPLKAFVDVLFRPSPYRDMPLFRGLFFASARQSGSPRSRLARLLGLNYAQSELNRTSRDFFTRDLFSVILPNDRALAGSTKLGRERHQLARAAGLIFTVAASLLLCGLFTLSFTNNWFALKRPIVDPCIKIEVNKGVLSQVLRPLDECRTSIESITPSSFWRKLSFNFGLGYAPHVGEALQERYLTEFREKVLGPIDKRIDQSLSSDKADALIVSFIIQRLGRLADCQQNGGCINRGDQKGLSYQTMLAVGQSKIKEGDPDIDRLQRTHEAYLLWQDDPKVVTEMYSKDLERIRNWSRRGNLTEDWVLESAKAQFAPIRATDFWEKGVYFQVDGAYTARAWREGISPLVSGLQKMATDQDFGAALKKFHENYQGRALKQWDNFLAKFPEGEGSLSAASTTREFGAKILGPESPYFRVIEAANANLSVIVGERWQGNNLDAWAAALKQYVTTKAKIQKGAATEKQPASDDKGQQQQEERASKYLTMYLDGVAELRTDLSAPDKCFKSAQKAFQDGEVSSKATHPLLKATWALAALKDATGARLGEDAIFWTLLERPLVLAWRAMLAETGRQLQEQWYRLRLGVRTQPDIGVVGEKIYGFATDGPAAPFLMQGVRWAPRKLLDQNVQFTDAFLYYLGRLRVDAIANPTLGSTYPTAEPPPFIVKTN